MSPENEYVLGTDATEIKRLGLQHRLWSAAAFEIWDRAGLAEGMSVLDVGSGPGFAAEEMARIVGPRGEVLAVDASQRFLDALTARAPKIRTLQADVQALELEASFDFAYARWVLCFVRDPQAVIQGVAKALVSGGRFAIQDYYRYLAMSLSPPSEPMRKVIDAVAASWRAQGGDPEIGLRLPGLLEKAGLRIKEVTPLVRIARPRDPLWDWPASFFRSNTPRLVEAGLLSRDDHQAFHHDWDERTRKGDSWFVTPPMLDLVAEKP